MKYESDSSSRLSPYLIELRDLHKNYNTPAGEFPALKDINLHIDGGEFVAIIGKSGAGKSTLVNMITGIDQPTTGEVYFAGASIKQLTEDQRARWRGMYLGIVFQFFQLLPTLNLIENVSVPMDLCNTIPIKERKSRALNLLEQVGIAEHAYKTPARISGGQQQRVAIARALANDPRVIIADEPTGNLDSHTAGEIFDLFSRLADQGKTLLVVSHEKELSRRASRVVEICDGEIWADCA